MKGWEIELVDTFDQKDDHDVSKHLTSCNSEINWTE